MEFETWRLALVLDDPRSMRVAAAWYALPVKHRTLARVRALSGVEDAIDIIPRLEAARMIGSDAEPPDIVKQLLNAFVKSKIPAAK